MVENKLTTIKTPLLLKVGIIILLVMILPTISLSAFLSQQTRKANQDQFLQSLSFGQNTLETTIAYILSQLDAAALRITSDPMVEVFGDNQALLLPPDIPAQLGVQIYTNPGNLILDRPLDFLNPFELGIFDFDAALNEPIQDVVVRPRGLYILLATRIYLSQGIGVLVLQSRLSPELFDVVKLSQAQDTTIYHIADEQRLKTMARGPSERDEVWAGDSRIPANLVFTTRYDVYGRRLENVTSAIPVWALYPEEQRITANRYFLEDLDGNQKASVYTPLPIGEPGEYIGHISLSAIDFVPGDIMGPLWIVVSGMLVLILIMSVLISRFIVRPIVELLEGVENLRHHLKDQGPLMTIQISSDDEIGVLAASFNALAGDLRASFQQIRNQKEEIQKYAETLELRVKERTQELEQARIRAEIANVHKSRFLVNMNHELRTPLNSISGVTDLLRFGAYEQTEEIISSIRTWCQENRNTLPPDQRYLGHFLETFADNLEQTENGISSFLKTLHTAAGGFRKNGESKSDWAESLETLLEQVEASLKQEQRSTFKAYATIREAGEILLNIIDEVIHLSRIESGVIEIQPVPRRVGELVNYAMVHTENFSRNKGKSNLVRLESKVSELVPQMILVDGQKIKQVLLNFMTNGVKYTEKGLVKLEVERVANHLIFSVTDTGMGIPEKDRGVIFTEFGRAFSVRDIEGTGLGLALSKKLVLAHGGTIGFESHENSGSRFWFTLPLELPEGTRELKPRDQASPEKED